MILLSAVNAGNPATVRGHYTRIFTYAFGAGSNSDVMKSIACENGGVFHQISDDDGPRLKEIMANYFVRLSHALALLLSLPPPPPPSPSPSLSPPTDTAGGGEKK